MIGLWTVLGVLAIVVVTAFAVARQVRVYRPVAAFTAFILTSDVARGLYVAPVVGLVAAGKTWGYVLVALDRLVVIGWWIGPLALAVHFFAQRRITPVLVLWGALWLPIADASRVHGADNELYLRVYALGLIALTWLTIAWGIVRSKDLRPGLPHLAVMLWAAADLAIVTVPLAHAFDEHWPFVRVANLTLYLLLILAHAFTLRRGPRTPHT